MTDERIEQIVSAIVDTVNAHQDHDTQAGFKHRFRSALKNHVRAVLDEATIAMRAEFAEEARAVWSRVADIADGHYQAAIGHADVDAWDWFTGLIQGLKEAGAPVSTPDHHPPPRQSAAPSPARKDTAPPNTEGKAPRTMRYEDDWDALRAWSHHQSDRDISDAAHRWADMEADRVAIPENVGEWKASLTSAFDAGMKWNDIRAVKWRDY